MESTFEDIKQYLIDNGKKICYPVDKSDFPADEPDKDGTITYEYPLRVSLNPNNSKDTLTLCYLKVNEYGIVTYEQPRDIILRYNETTNTIQEYNEHTEYVLSWKDLEFDKNGHYIDEYTNDEWLPLHSLKFFNSKKDIKDYIEDYKTNNTGHYIKMLQWWIDMCSADIEKYNEKIEKHQKYIEGRMEIINCMKNKMAHAKHHIPDFLKAPEKDGLYETKGGHIVKLLSVTVDGLSWGMEKFKSTGKNIDFDYFDTYLDGQVNYEYYNYVPILEAAIDDDYDIVKKL